MPLQSAIRNPNSAIALLGGGGQHLDLQLFAERRAPQAFEFGDPARDQLLAAYFNLKSRAAHATDDAQRRADLRRDSLDARALRLLEADDDARRRLAEQLRRRRQFAREFYGRADALAPE